MFSPLKLGEMIQNDEYFSNGLKLDVLPRSGSAQETLRGRSFDHCRSEGTLTRVKEGMFFFDFLEEMGLKKDIYIYIQYT